MRSRAWFVTATGTEMGKTHLCELLLAHWRMKDLGVDALKPAMSGFSDPHDPENDAARLLHACGRPVDADSLDEIAPFRFRAALAPDAAARHEGATLTMAELAPKLAKFFEGGAERKLIEGAGGVMSPIAEDGLNIDLIRKSDLPVILVAGAYLGTISHTLTAIDALRVRAIPVAAVMVNFYSADGESIDSTADDIRRHICSTTPVIDLPSDPARQADAIGALADTLTTDSAISPDRARKDRLRSS